MQYRGMVATAFGIVREEGALKLWQGVTPALYRHVVYRWAFNQSINQSIDRSINQLNQPATNQVLLLKFK